MKLSFLFTDIVPDVAELDHRMAALSDLGYRGVDLPVSHPLPYSVEEIEALSRRNELPVVALATGWSYGCEGLCLASPDEVARGRAVGRLIQYTRSAARLGSMLSIGRMQGQSNDERNQQLGRERIEDSLAMLSCYAVDLGARIVLKPVNHLQGSFFNTAAEVAALIDELSLPATGVMLDTMHMHLEERSPIETIRRYGSRTWHFQLCETNGGPFGSGGLDIPQALDALAQSGYDRFVSVKIYRKVAWEEAARGAIAYLRDHCGRFH